MPSLFTTGRTAALLLVMALVLGACAAERPGEAGDDEVSDAAATAEAPSEGADASADTSEDPAADEATADATEATDDADDATEDDAGAAAALPVAEAPELPASLLTEDTEEGPPANLRTGCATAEVDGDWFPEKVSFDHASGIAVTYAKNVKVLSIARPNDAATEPVTVVMLQCGTELPADLEADVVVEVPVQRAATYSTTFLQGFEMIDAVDRLVAHGGLGFVSSEAIIAAADAGDIIEVGDQTSPDLEALASVEPDVVLVSAGFSGADPIEPFAALDVPVIPNASFLETDPVARAEWLKLEAMLLNHEADITPKFDEIAGDYAELTALAEDVPEDEQPLVLTNAPFEGVWYASGADSYTAELISDAAGVYVFADQPGTTLQLDLESVLAAGQDADVWLSAGSVSLTPEEFAATDERLAEFAAFPDAVWANDADLGPSGGNRFFEDGAVRPDLVLADILSILHPDLLPDHEPRFFGQLGSNPGGTAGASG